MKYGSRPRVWPKIRHLAPLDGCACAFEEWVYGGPKVLYNSIIMYCKQYDAKLAQMSCVYIFPDPCLWLFSWCRHNYFQCILLIFWQQVANHPIWVSASITFGWKLFNDVSSNRLVFDKYHNLMSWLIYKTERKQTNNDCVRKKCIRTHDNDRPEHSGGLMNIANSYSFWHVLGKVHGALGMLLYIGRQIFGSCQYGCVSSHLRGREDSPPGKTKTIMDTCITGDCVLKRTR